MKFLRRLLPLLMLTAAVAATEPTHAQATATTKKADQASVQVTIEERSNVRVIITDAQGAELATVHEGMLDAGDHTITFDAAKLPAGQWFYKVTANPIGHHEQASLNVHVDERSRVVVTIVDANGRYLATAFDGVLNAGDHTVKFDSSKMPEGEWFYRLTTERASDPVSLRNH